MVYCVRLARALVDDYCCLVPGSVQTLKQILSASPRFCCQLITSVTALYDLSSGKLQTGRGGRSGDCHSSHRTPRRKARWTLWPFVFSLKRVFSFRLKGKGRGRLDFWNLPAGSFPWCLPLG